MKLALVLLLFAIVCALGSAVYFLVRKQDASSRNMLWSLTARIALSLCLFALLLVSYWLGWISPRTPGF